MIGLCVAFIYSKLVYRKEKEPPRINFTLYPLIYNGMILIPIKDKAIRIHHWMLSIGILAWLLNCKKQYNMFVGFCIGLIFHGLTYNDCFEFITLNPY